MKYTLLEMVQSILTSMGSDEVNSYSDTTESNDVATVIRDTYWYIVGRGEFPANHTFFQLDASGDNTKPCVMTVPSDAVDFEYIKYKHTDSGNTIWNYVEYLPLEEFITRVLSFTESSSNISTMTISLDGTDFIVKFYTDRNPKFYTTVEDKVIFDGYDSSVENTLQSSNTLCYGKKIPTFTMSDTFTPELSAEQFQLLLNEAKSMAFVEIKQTENPKAEERARKSFITSQRTKRNLPSKVPEIKRIKGYGRK